jgi:hypothetical protein
MIYSDFIMDFESFEQGSTTGFKVFGNHGGWLLEA